MPVGMTAMSVMKSGDVWGDHSVPNGIDAHRAAGCRQVLRACTPYSDDEISHPLDLLRRRQQRNATFLASPELAADLRRWWRLRWTTVGSTLRVVVDICEIVDIIGKSPPLWNRDRPPP
jgi:hypothetical protein